MRVGHSQDLRTSRRLPKNDEVRKSVELHPARARRVFGELPGIIRNAADRAVKLVQEHLRRPQTALPVPPHGGLGFFEGERVDSNRPGSPNHLSPEAATRFVPRDGSDGSAVNLLEATADFLAPGFFRGRVAPLIQTANQGVDERATRLGRQG